MLLHTSGRRFHTYLNLSKYFQTHRMLTSMQTTACPNAEYKVDQKHQGLIRQLHRDMAHKRQQTDSASPQPTFRKHHHSSSLQIVRPHRAHSGQQRSSCLDRQDGDVVHPTKAQNNNSKTACEGPLQTSANLLSDTQCTSSSQQSDVRSHQGQPIDICQPVKLQSGISESRQSLKLLLVSCFLAARPEGGLRAYLLDSPRIAPQ